MGAPRVRCNGCERAWHSATLESGLRLVGSCPRCGGELTFADGTPLDQADGGESFSRTLLPHLVMGPPRL